MPIIGTAGHVDHGKSSLVTALTGTNPDRWLEERQRGMTLDLGFAPLLLENGTEAGIVDVPGHERFLHNMLAGAAGMDLLLLAVAANEGVMPQTIEHLQILRFLGVQRAIVVVTKADLLDEEELGQACADIREALRGTVACDASLVAVSAISGRGLDELRDAISQELTALPACKDNAPAFLPIDRVFTLPGRGTIVTGTLMQGVIAEGEAIVIEPVGKRARVRSIHVFGNSRQRAGAGTRVALNLPGLRASELKRGDSVAGREFSPQTSLAVRFTPLEDSLSILRRRTPVRAYIGSGETLGTLVFECVPWTELEVSALLHLRTPAIGFPGLHFVVRRVSPKTLLGGGVIEGAAAPFQAREDGGDAIESLLAALLRERGFQATEAGQAAFLANLREDVARPALDALADRGELQRIERPDGYIDALSASDALVRVLEYLWASEAREPWAMGVTSLALSRALGLAEPLLVRLLGAFAGEGRLAKRAGYYATLGHEPRLTAEQKAFFEHLLPNDPSAAFLPTPLAPVLAELKGSAIEGMSKAFESLLVRGVLVKIGDDLYRGTQIAAIHAKIVAEMDCRERMTMAEFRDVLGTSRKYAVPLLEWFDARGITVRAGDYRTLRRKGDASIPV